VGGRLSQPSALKKYKLSDENSVHKPKSFKGQEARGSKKTGGREKTRDG